MTGEDVDGAAVDRVEALRAAAEAGDAAAQLELANRHHFGDGVRQDPAEAYRWMRKAAEAGLAEAQSKVGYFLTEGLGVDPDPKGALKWFLRGLRGGYAKAGYNLGDAFRTGRHATYSPRRAWFFFSKAAELGLEAAHYGLARLCYRGQGVPRDVEKSMEHLRRAVRGGDALAIVEMGRVYRAGHVGREDLAEAEERALARHRPGDLASLSILFELRREAATPPPPPPGLDEVEAELNRRQARRREAVQPAAEAFREGIDLYWRDAGTGDVAGALALLESAAGAGNADAARFLGLAYDGYGGGVPKDHEAAMRWFEEAARLGDAHGCFVVGVTLLEAEAPEGRVRGFELIERAAALGFPHACGYLGSLFARGADFWNDFFEEEAFPLLRLGAVRGDQGAAWTLARLLEREGGRERLREAAYWHLRFARRDAGAARSLGYMYGRGTGVEQSDEAATAWLALAAEEGDREAATQLARCFFDGCGVPRDPVVAASLAERAAAGGFGPAARLLGEVHTDGLGVPRDAAVSAEWYRKGAELGDAFSMRVFAERLFDGCGVEPDPAAAVAWLERADAEGQEGRPLLSLMLFRGEGAPPDPARARRLFLLAVADEHLPTLFTTIEEEALRFRRAGTRPKGLQERIEEAVRDLEALPAEAALDAGLMLWNGNADLVRDDAVAAELFRTAAEKGSALGAACLSHARAFAGDLEGEREWLGRAAAAGLPGAQRHLAIRLVETRRAGWDDLEVVALLESAANGGDAIACFELARHLERTGAAGDARGAERVAALRSCAEAGGYAADATADA